MTGTLAFVALLLSVAGAPSDRAVNAHSFLALGDSYTIGESVQRRDSWPEQLAAKLRSDGIAIEPPEIVARTGWTTDELSEAMDRAALRGPYALVTLLIGVNDQYRGRDAVTFRPRFVRLLERGIALAGGDARHVVVISIPDYGVTPFATGRDPASIAAAIDSFNAVCREEAERHHARFADVTPISRRAAADGTLVADDGLHPSALMYREWLAVIAPEAGAALRTR